MVEQLHFHSSKWLFSLSTCELKTGKDIIHVPREDIAIWDMLKGRSQHFIKSKIPFIHLPTHPSKKQTKKLFDIGATV